MAGTPGPVSALGPDVRRLLVGAAGVAVAAAAFAVYWFEPHKLFIDDKVDEAVPVVAGADVGETVPDGSRPPATAATPPLEPVELAAGVLRGIQGHDVRAGRAVVLELPDGTRFLRLEDLDAENGPDLKVYLSAEPHDGRDAAHDDDYVNLGGLKGNIGSSNYEIPPEVDLAHHATAVIWCERFSVGFAVAPLTPGAGRG